MIITVLYFSWEGKHIFFYPNLCTVQGMLTFKIILNKMTLTKITAHCLGWP